MNPEKFTIKTQEAIQEANNIAQNNGQQLIENGHILKGLMNVDTTIFPYIMKEEGIDTGSLENEIDAIIVASYGTFSTGINIRNLHNIIFASPSKSRVRALQSIGRGLRKSETKDTAVLYDISDDFTYKSKKNFTINHFMERINIYNEEQFNYEISRIKIK